MSSNESLTSLATGFSEMTFLPALKHFRMISGWEGIGRERMTVLMSERERRASRFPAEEELESDSE